jgi:arylsulfatase
LVLSGLSQCCFVYKASAGEPVEGDHANAEEAVQDFVGPVLTPGKYTVGMEFTREKAGQYHESIGSTKLYVNDKVVAEGPMRAPAGKFTLAGDGLCVGRDSGDAVSKQYTSPNGFKGELSSALA